MGLRLSYKGLYKGSYKGIYKPTVGIEGFREV